MAWEQGDSITQIFEALDVLAGSEGLGPAELGRALGVPTSTSHRLLVTLEHAGFAQRDSTATKYELGNAASNLVFALFRQYRIRHLALPGLAQIATQCGETAALDVRVGWYTVRMGGTEGWHEVRASPRIGRTRPLFDGAAGRAVLAGLPDQEIGRFLEWEAHGRPRTARTREVRAALTRVREDGSAVVEQDGDAELAVAVRVDGRALAAVTVQGVTLIDPGQRDEVLTTVGRVVADLESALATAPGPHDPFGHLDPDDIHLRS